MNKIARNCVLNAMLVFLGGILAAGVIFHFSGLRYFPSSLADIYREDRIVLQVPGSKDVQLTRAGAYGIYFQYSLVSAALEPVHIPPAIDCSLKANTGQIIEGVPDYEPTNRYWSKKGGGPATLIKSVTIEEPGLYEFSCQHQGDYSGPALQVSLGPNYAWEFIRISLKNILAILGMFLSVTVPLLVCIALFCAAWYFRRNG